MINNQSEMEKNRIFGMELFHKVFNILIKFRSDNKSADIHDLLTFFYAYCNIRAAKLELVNNCTMLFLEPSSSTNN